VIIITHYDEKYSAYRPFWEYCIEQAYPHYAHYCQESTYPAITRLLIDPFPSHYNTEDELEIEYHHFHYITDIDIMILPEPISMKEFHLREMEESGLCYSNSHRGSGELRGQERMTGLHFVGLEWFKRTQAARDEYRKRAEAGEFTDRIDDELILMRVIKESGLGLPPKRNLMVRHHGIHFGTFRAYKNHTNQRRYDELRKRISPEKAIQWQQVISAGHWKGMVRKAPEWLQWEMQEMDIFTRKRSKQGG
jgi:hypothetical protein